MTGFVNTGFGPDAPGIDFGPASRPIWKAPTGMSYGSGVGASSGIGSGLVPTLRFASGMAGLLTGGGRSRQSQQPQPTRMAGSPDFLRALQSVSSNNSGGGFTNMGDGFSMYLPPAPGATVKEKVKSSGGAAGSRSTGSRIAGGATGALGGAATGAQLGSVVPGLGTAAGAGIGAVAGGLGGIFG